MKKGKKNNNNFSYVEGFQSYIPSMFKNWGYNNEIKDPVLKTSFEYVKVKNQKSLFLINIYSYGFQIINIDDPQKPKELISTKQDQIKFIKVTRIYLTF